MSIVYFFYFFFYRKWLSVKWPQNADQPVSAKQSVLNRNNPKRLCKKERDPLKKCGGSGDNTAHPNPPGAAKAAKAAKDKELTESSKGH